MIQATSTVNAVVWASTMIGVNTLLFGTFLFMSFVVLYIAGYIAILIFRPIFKILRGEKKP